MQLSNLTHHGASSIRRGASNLMLCHTSHAHTLVCYRVVAVGGVMRPSAMLEYNLLHTTWPLYCMGTQKSFQMANQSNRLWNIVSDQLRRHFINFESCRLEVGYSRNEVRRVRHHRSSSAIDQPPVHCNHAVPTWAFELADSEIGPLYR